MSVHGDIKERLKAFMSGGSQLIRCTVVQSDDVSCTVKLQSGLEVSDVRLKPTLDDNSNYLVAKPKAGTSAILWSASEDLTQLTLIMADEYEDVTYKAGDLELWLDSKSGKVKLKSGGVSLKSLMEDIHRTISNLIVICPPSGGPSTGLDPSTEIDLGTFDANLKKLLTD